MTIDSVSGKTTTNIVFDVKFRYKDMWRHVTNAVVKVTESGAFVLVGFQVSKGPDPWSQEITNVVRSFRYEDIQEIDGLPTPSLVKEG